MTHDKYTEWIQLAALGELDDQNRRMLDAHLEACADCRAHYDELVDMMTVVHEARAAAPTDRELELARGRLREAIRGASIELDQHESAPARYRDMGDVHRAGVSGLIGWLQGGIGRVAFAGATAVAVGIVIGYLAFGRAGGQLQPVSDPIDKRATVAEAQADQELGPPSYANVRFVDVDPRSGQIQLEYDMVRPVRLRADIEDERVQRMLAHTVLNEKNPGVKLRAIQTIDAYLESPKDEEVKKALIQALKTDPSPGVRKHALYVLFRMPFDQDIKDACLFVLANDENPGMRIAAINILSAATLDGHIEGNEVYDVLAEQADENDYMRIRSGAFMQEVNGNGN
ncbi:MAG: HEAT repeat domain-containing protein [Candidatus Latescibacterota bacterium]|nr:MAG: HEAT repeat domain-containing protein [Candidatus Latescibacterota bacterium]